MRRPLLALAIGVLLAVPAVAQRGDYLEVMTVKLKPEKSADFRAVARRIADANRRHGGDNWLAVETVYGEGGTHSFISPRKDFAAIDGAFKRFMNAMIEGFGPAGMEKTFADFESCLQSSRSEVRRRRWDLSANAPAGEEANKMIGNARWLGVTRVQVRPGRIPDFETSIKRVKDALERTSRDRPVLVSQTAYGGPGGTFHITRILDSFAGFDAAKPLREVLGDEGYEQYSRDVREMVTETESSIMRIVPEYSNMAKEITAVAPDFWNPKPKPAQAAKKKQ
jgi:hypothetical protein